MADYYIGLISGTSMDGVDAALLDGRLEPPRGVHYLHHPYPGALRERLLNLAEDRTTFSLDDYGRLDSELGVQFARAALDLLQEARLPATQVRAIGSHGQTVRHRPRGPNPFSLQIGDPNRIAALTGITTVADFRRRDLALGGEGAPLVPAFHNACLRAAHEDRVVLNLGGIANITVLPADAGAPVTGFDTGPANVLLDAWCQQHRQQDYDAGGAWAAAGTPQPALLEQLLQHDYLARPAPKSTGREEFSLAWLETQLARLGTEPAPVDVQATLAQYSARTVADAIRRHAPATRKVLVCGGGAHNADLLRRLQALLPDVRVETTDVLGLDPDQVEALAFAWLARQTLEGRPGNLPAVTGARAPAVLGGIYPA
jgi:anhydro-N-acetylmuramic acid kinase